jgi:hypothetical protein
MKPLEDRIDGWIVVCIVWADSSTPAKVKAVGTREVVYVGLVRVRVICVW